MARTYDTFMLTDEPKLCGIPIVTALPCMGLTLVGLLVGYGFQFFAFGAAVSLVLHFKFNAQGIRFFLSMVYWMLPSVVSRAFFGLRRSPDSAKRIYLQ